MKRNLLIIAALCFFFEISEKAEGYLRQADYYSRKKDSSRAKTYSYWANDASEKARLRMKWAQEAREKSRLRMKWAENEMNK